MAPPNRSSAHAGRKRRRKRASIERWSKNGDIATRRDAILRSLNSVLKNQQHPYVLRMQDIADHLGLVKGNLYYYFKSKKELIYYARLRCLESSLTALERARKGSGTSSTRLHTLLVEHILGIIEGDYSAMLLADTSLPHRQSYISMRDKFEQGVRELIQDGIAAGEFAPQNVSLAGFAILGTINWIPRWYRPTGKLSASQIAEQFATFLLRALRP